MMRINPTWLITALLATGCTSATQPDRSSEEPTTIKQSLGEANIAFWFGGDGAEAMPSYDERVAWSILNQIRMNTDVYDVQDQDGNLIPPAPPLVQQVGMTEAGRWQGAQSLANVCYCVLNPMTMAFEEAGGGSNPYTCCTAGYVNGTIRCVGPTVACGDDGMMEPTDRWGLLNKGPGEIRTELFYTTNDEEEATGVAAANWLLGGALAVVLNPRDAAGAAARTSTPIIPEECKPPEDTCEGGSCVGPAGESDCDPSDPDAPNECIGTCEGGANSGEFCTLPEPIDAEACDPANLPRGYYWSFMVGQSSDPTPFLNDVIHFANEDGNAVFTNYFDPAGDPQTIEIVTDSACHAMDRTYARPVENDPDLPYAGNTYHYSPTETSGCVRYIAHAVDAEGFDHVYPTFGSLGMKLEGGEIVPNDESCPIWVPDVRPAPVCMAAAEECSNGATRLCYTGRPGTEDKGMCDVGSETCQNGRWSGLCEGEIRPESDDVCDDGVDNNCNGFVDEDCPVPFIPDPDMGSGGNNGDADMGGGSGTNGGGEPDPGDKGEDDGGCCTTIAGSQDSDAPAMLLVGLLGALGLRRRR